MASVVLFHSIYGLRSLELRAAERMRAAGHDVITPDLYEGWSTDSIDQGFAMKDRIGWPLLCERAEKAVSGLPQPAVLGGFSMGAGVAGALWPTRPKARGMLLLHGLCDIPANARQSPPVQLHLADPDVFEPAESVAWWRGEATKAGIAAEIFMYPGAGHLYTDATLPDYDADAAALTWQRVLAFLDAV